MRVAFILYSPRFIFWHIIITQSCSHSDNLEDVKIFFWSETEGHD